MIYELAPVNIKEPFTSFCMSFSWVLNFTSTKYLPLFLEVFLFHGSMFFFAGVCILSAIYIIVFVPETMGKSCEQIMESLQGKSENRAAEQNC